MAADPVKNTLFLRQLYSELAREVGGTLDDIAAFPHPVIADACLSRVDQRGLRNTASTYKEVWDTSFPNEMSSFNSRDDSQYGLPLGVSGSMGGSARRSPPAAHFEGSLC
ncbi:MAG TPA: hypothetical protein VER33_28480 [Polyangiaceae bacterium]|nr:hypothetical protein [Polyangiaceae bacterium]